MRWHRLIKSSHDSNLYIVIHLTFDDLTNKIKLKTQKTAIQRDCP